jgi:hypothetical protein
VLTAAEVAATGQAIARAQRANGAIPWPDGHIDAWDHVECAMALNACGRHAAARRAFGWLISAQRGDGSWPRSTLDGQVADPAAEAHHAAYIAVGVWHDYLVTGDADFVRDIWPVVRDALTWTLALRTPSGAIAWERDAAGQAGRFALLSGCASIYQALRCAVVLGKLADEPRPDWEDAAGRLGDLVAAARPGDFADKSRFAMDWYYPVLGGALRGEAARDRLLRGWERFVVPGRGIRCVHEEPWVTVAESCELVLALEAIGMRAEAEAVFATAARYRLADGSYWTGWQFANGQPFPDEQSSWTAAAVLLAQDALYGPSGGGGIFRDVPGS